jgi:hypothetical protein
MKRWSFDCTRKLWILMIHFSGSLLTNVELIVEGLSRPNAPMTGFRK